jgi:hypothetical protein
MSDEGRVAGARTPPPRSAYRRREALAKASAVRSRRADEKKRMTLDRARALVVASQEDWALTWRVSAVLAALPGVGRVRVERIMRRAQVADGKTLGGLTDRQRAALEGALVALAPPGARHAGKDATDRGTA